MSNTEFELNAEPRSDLGKGASRRLRCVGKVPGIIYGGNGEPTPIYLDHNEILRRLEHEAFYSHILNVKLAGRTEKAVLKAMQRHPARPMVIHVDLLRVDTTHKIHMKVPLHFINEESAPGVKIGGGQISHYITSVEVECLASNLPEYLTVDLAGLQLGESIHLSQLAMPEGVVLTLMAHGGKDDQPVVSIEGPQSGGEEATAAG